MNKLEVNCEREGECFLISVGALVFHNIKLRTRGINAVLNANLESIITE